MGGRRSLHGYPAAVSLDPPLAAIGHSNGLAHHPLTALHGRHDVSRCQPPGVHLQLRCYRAGRHLLPHTTFQN